MPDAPKPHLDYALIPLISPSVKAERLSLALPDGLLSLRPATAAPAFVLKVVIEGEMIEAIIPRAAALTLRDALTEMIADAPQATAEPEAAR